MIDRGNTDTNSAAPFGKLFKKGEVQFWKNFSENFRCWARTVIAWEKSANMKAEPKKMKPSIFSKNTD